MKYMQLSLVAAATSLALTGCGIMSKSSQGEKVLASPTPPVLKDITVNAAGKVEAPMTIDVPSWYIKPPGASENYVWITGTGFSNDLAMSRKKAMMDSQIQLADKINGVISAMVKQNMRDEAGGTTLERTSSFARKVIIDTAITGHMLEDSRVIAENRGYRTFVLVRYPLGDSNRMLKEKLNIERQENWNNDAAEQELDREIQRRGSPRSARPPAEPALSQSLGSDRMIEVPIEPQVQAADPLNRYR